MLKIRKDIFKKLANNDNKLEMTKIFRGYFFHPTFNIPK